MTDAKAQGNLPERESKASAEARRAKHRAVVAAGTTSGDATVARLTGTGEELFGAIALGATDTLDGDEGLRALASDSELEAIRRKIREELDSKCSS